MANKCIEKSKYDPSWHRWPTTIALTASLLFGGLSSCTMGDQEKPHADALVEILPQAQFPDGDIETSSSNTPQTKAPANEAGSLMLYFVRADETTSGTYGAWSASAFLGTRTGGSGAQAITFSPKHYYLPGREVPLKTKLTGWYPGGAPTANDASGKGYYNNSTNTVSWLIDGTQDIMTSARMEGSRLPGNGIGVMPFKHQLAQIQVYVYAENAGAADAWGNVGAVSIGQQRTQCSYNIKTSDATGAVTFTGTANSTFEIYKSADGTGTAIPTTKAGAKLLGTVMIEPKTAVALNLSLYTKNHSSLSNIAFPQQSYEASKAYKLYIRFLKTDVVPTATIGEWIAGGEAESEPEATPAIMIYGSTNGSITTNLIGSIRSSYNGFTGKVNTAPGNGLYQTSETNIYSNEKGYEKLEVAFSDEPDPTGATSMNWSGAMKACKDKTTDGGGWRLPRLSELRLMYLNKGTLEKIPGFGAFNPSYWSANQYDLTTSWYIQFSNGLAGANSVQTHKVRCVREIPFTPAKIYYGDANNNGGITSGNTNTSSSSTITMPGYTTDSYNNNNSEDLYGDELATITSEKAYYRLEVAYANELNPMNGNEIMTWKIAKQVCKDKTTDGGGWRLPRFSELMLMGFNRSSLNNTSEFTPFEDIRYWSANVMSIHANGTYFPWVIDFKTGYLSNYNAGNQLKVRCVREL